MSEFKENAVPQEKPPKTLKDIAYDYRMEHDSIDADGEQVTDAQLLNSKIGDRHAERVKDLETRTKKALESFPGVTLEMLENMAYSEEEDE